MQCVRHLAGRCCCDYMVRQEIKKSCQLNTPINSCHFYCITFYTVTQFHMLNQKMFFSCTVLSILYILEEVLMCPVLRLVLEFLNYLRNVSPSSSTNLTKPGSSISSSTLQIILPHYHSSNYANHLLQLLLQHLHFLRPTQKYHTHLYIHRSLFQNHHHCLFFFGLSKKFLVCRVVLLFWFQMSTYLVQLLHIWKIRVFNYVIEVLACFHWLFKNKQPIRLRLVKQ